MYSGANLASAAGSRIGERGTRQLAVAVLASLVLHALILLGLSHVKEGQRSRAAAAPLTARLAKPDPPFEQTTVEPRPASTAHAAPRIRKPVPVSAAPISSIESSSKTDEPTLAPPPVPVQPAVRVEARTETQPGPAAASGPDPGSVARYRLELMEAAARYKRYPRIARENDWEGRVELLIAFAESGAIASMSVKRSSGRAVLDEEAQAMIRSAQPHTIIPPALRGRSFALETAVNFALIK